MSPDHRNDQFHSALYLYWQRGVGVKNVYCEQEGWNTWRRGGEEERKGAMKGEMRGEKRREMRGGGKASREKMVEEESQPVIFSHCCHLPGLNTH